MATRNSTSRRSTRRTRRTARLVGGGRTAQKRAEPLLLRLYVTGATPASLRAIQNARALCQQHLAGRYQLEVYDIYQMPALAKDHQIIAAPTLVKVLPAPLRRFVGDLSRSESVLFGLDLREGR